MAIRFHCRLLNGGERDESIREQSRRAREMALPDLDAQVRFCRAAEHAGIDSLLVNVNYGTPDPMLLATALAHRTDTIRFMVANRPGLVSPTLFVQQVNTLSVLSGGRVVLNIVAGHSPAEQRYYGDMLGHDERYERMEEYLTICHALWDGGEVDFEGKHYHVEKARLNTPFIAEGRSRPEIFLGGSSDQARRTAMKHASCWVTFADAPGKIAADISSVVAHGVEAGLRLATIVRPTRAEAIEFADSLVRPSAGREQKVGEESHFVSTSDSVSMRAIFDAAREEWLTPFLWAGAVRTYGATAVALVGSPEDVAAGIMEFHTLGVTNFILSGWPKLDEMIRFGNEVIPLVRQAERNLRNELKVQH